MEEFDQINYKGYLIDKIEHPALYGKYEIYKAEPLRFVAREITLKEAKVTINLDIKNEKV